MDLKFVFNDSEMLLNEKMKNIKLSKIILIYKSKAPKM